MQNYKAVLREIIDSVYPLPERAFLKIYDSSSVVNISKGITFIRKGARYEKEYFILMGVVRFHLFGHSWGGLYAQIYAEKRPERMKSLFLCSPSSGTNIVWGKMEDEVMEYNKNNSDWNEWLMMGLNSLLGKLGCDCAYQNLFEQVMLNYNKGFEQSEVDLSNLSKINSEPINDTRGNIIDYPLLKRFANPPFAVTVTYGDRDIYGESKENVYNRYPTAGFFVIENSGHFPWLHNPAAFNKILADFFNINLNTSNLSYN